MKFALFVVLSCLSVCSVISLTEHSRGNVDGYVMGVENVFIRSGLCDLDAKQHSVTFPKVRLMQIFEFSDALPQNFF